MKKWISALLVSWICTPLLVAQNARAITVNSQAKQVTLFQSSAQVNRTAVVELLAGRSNVRFTKLSPYISEKSIQVKAPEGVKIISVKLQLNFTDSIARNQQLIALETKIKTIEKESWTAQNTLTSLNEELNFMRDNRVIGGKEQPLPLTQLKETAIYMRERTSAILSQQTTINESLNELAKRKEQYQKELQQLQSKKTNSQGEIVIELQSDKTASVPFSLSYQTEAALWYPTYDLIAKSVNDPIQLTLKGTIVQNTTEEWNNICLILSSGNPNQSNYLPDIIPYYLNYNTRPPVYGENLRNSLKGNITGYVYDSSNTPLIGASITVKNSQIGTITDLEGKYTLPAMDPQTEITASYIGMTSKTQSALDPTFHLEDNQLNVNETVVVGYGSSPKKFLSAKVAGITASSSDEKPRIKTPEANNSSVVMNQIEYSLKANVSIQSNNQPQTFEIEQFSLPAHFEYKATPKIEKSAFLTSQIINQGTLNLVDGEVSLFYDNTYIGKSILQPNTASDTLSFSLGRDNGISVKRENRGTYNSKSIFGKQETSRHWLTTLRNNKPYPISIKVYDQIPISSNSEIDVITDELSGGNVDPKTGIISWNININPGATHEITLKYRVRSKASSQIILD